MRSQTEIDHLLQQQAIDLKHKYLEEIQIQKDIIAVCRRTIKNQRQVLKDNNITWGVL